MQNQIILVEDVIRDTLSVLERQGYKIHITRKYNTVYRALAKYCQDHNDGEYSGEIGEAFIQSLRNRDKQLGRSYLNTYILAVERVNQVAAGEEDWYPHKKGELQK